MRFYLWALPKSVKLPEQATCYIIFMNQLRHLILCEPSEKQCRSIPLRNLLATRLPMYRQPFQFGLLRYIRHGCHDGSCSAGCPYGGNGTEPQSWDYPSHYAGHRHRQYHRQSLLQNKIHFPNSNGNAWTATQAKSAIQGSEQSLGWQPDAQKIYSRG